MSEIELFRRSLIKKQLDEALDAERRRFHHLCRKGLHATFSDVDQWRWTVGRIRVYTVELLQDGWEP